MSKNKQSIIYGIVNGVLALLAQQVAAGVYPIAPAWQAPVGGLLALVITAVTLASPFFSVRQAVK